MAKAKIPSGVTAEDFMEVRKYLTRILAATNAKHVIMRLNKSGEELPIPYFIGWVEDAETRNKRIEKSNAPDPGLLRFGENDCSKVYMEVYNSADPSKLLERRWQTPYPDKSEGAKALVPESGVKYQTYVALVVGAGKQRRCVGTLSAGFAEKSKNGEDIRRVMEDWAQKPQSKLLQYLQRKFDLGGRILGK